MDSVYLIIVDDHSSGPEYLIMSTKEKAREAMRAILLENYREEDGTVMDECGHDINTCLRDLFYGNGEDYVVAIKVKVDSMDFVR